MNAYLIGADVLGVIMAAKPQEKRTLPTGRMPTAPPPAYRTPLTARTPAVPLSSSKPAYRAAVPATPFQAVHKPSYSAPAAPQLPTIPTAATPAVPAAKPSLKTAAKPTTTQKPVAKDDTVDRARAAGKVAANRISVVGKRIAKRHPGPGGRLAQTARRLLEKGASIQGDVLGQYEHVASTSAAGIPYAAYMDLVGAANAVAQAGEIADNLQPVVDQVAARDEVLANEGQAIVNRAIDVINAFDPDQPNTAVIATVARIQNDATAWQARTQATSIPVAPPPPGVALPPGDTGGGASGAPEGDAGFGDAGGGIPPPGGAGEEPMPKPLPWEDLHEEATAEAPEEEYPEFGEPTEDSGESEDAVEGAEARVNRYLCGADILGAETIPKVGATYTDYATVLAVQKALKARGFDPGKIDGIYGSDTAKAIKAMQATVPGAGQSGVIDYGVLAALRVSAPTGQTPAKDALPSPGGWPLASSGIPSAATAAASTGWWSQPLWEGAPYKRWQGALGGAAAAAFITALILALRGRK